MSMRRKAVCPLLLALAILTLRTGDSYGGAVSGDLTSGWRSAAASGTGTTALFVYSKQTAPPPASENATSRHFVLIDPSVFVPDIANPIPVAPAPPGFQVNINVDARSVGPSLSAGNQPKQRPDVQGQRIRGDTAFSSSGSFFGQASAVTNSVTDGKPDKPFVSALGRSRGGAGAAAGAAFDPFEVDPGTYVDYQYTLNASLQLDQVSDFGGVTFFALDDRLMQSPASLDTFYQRGQPFNEALWTLSISLNGVPAQPGDVNVSFRTNPMALDDNILFLDLDGDTDNDLNDRLIESLIQQEIKIVDGTAILNSFDLFPAGTAYNVNRIVMYADGVNAALISVSVPEPPVIALFGLGTLCLWAGVRRPRPSQSGSGASAGCARNRRILGRSIDSHATARSQSVRSDIVQVLCTSSAATPGRRSTFPSPKRVSMTTFSPST